MRRSCEILAVLAAMAVCGCQARPAGTGAAGYADDEEYQAQVDAYNRQTEQQDRILAQQEAEMERAIKQADKLEEHSERVDKLLTKQEEQAKRWDAILDAEEKRTGIKP